MLLEIGWGILNSRQFDSIQREWNGRQMQRERWENDTRGSSDVCVDWEAQWGSDTPGRALFANTPNCLHHPPSSSNLLPLQNHLRPSKHLKITDHFHVGPSCFQNFLIYDLSQSPISKVPCNMLRRDGSVGTIVWQNHVSSRFLKPPSRDSISSCMRPWHPGKPHSYCWKRFWGNFR